MNELSLPQLAGLRTLRLAYAEEPIVMIGAAALAFHLPMNWRTTADIDLVLAVSASELETVVARLPGWRHDLEQEQRWSAPDNVRVDLVPAPPEALDQPQLVWPRTTDVMNLGGMRLALATPRREIAPGILIAIASVPVIALLKMAAYLERPGNREKDLQDLGHILDEMVDEYDREIVHRYMNSMTTRPALDARDRVGSSGSERETASSRTPCRCGNPRRSPCRREDNCGGRACPASAPGSGRQQVSLGSVEVSEHAVR